MEIKSNFHEVTSSYFWLLGVLIVIILFLLCLIAILVPRYRWYKKRLSVFYCGGAERGLHFGHQYLVRLSFERNPTQYGHDRNCQVFIELWQEKDVVFIIPMPFNKQIYEFKKKPTSVVLVRTNDPVSNLRAGSAQLKCSDSCRIASKQMSDQLLEQLQIMLLGVQKVPSKLMITAKIAMAGDPKGPSRTTMTKPQHMEQDRFYSFAVEQLQPIDYHLIRHAICCLSDSWIVFNFLTICLILLLTASLQVYFFARDMSLIAFEATLVICSSVSGTIFFISALYLYVVGVQDKMYVNSMGRSVGGRFLHVGALFLLTFLGLGSAIGAITMLQSLEHHAFEASITEKTSSYRGLGISFISVTVFIILEVLVSFLDSKTNCLGNVFWSSTDPQVCPQKKTEKPSLKETLAVISK